MNKFINCKFSRKLEIMPGALMESGSAASAGARFVSFSYVLPDEGHLGL